MNILIPMAGAGKRFRDAGYSLPKPMIDVLGEPMIAHVIENLPREGRFIFVARDEDLANGLREVLVRARPDSLIIAQRGMLPGQASSCLLARDLINNVEPLIIANADQLLTWNPESFLAEAATMDGLIATFKSSNPHHSYAATDQDGWVTRVAEKVVISDQATCGVYYFGEGSDFVRAADSMIARNIRTNGEFYVCPVYNEMIRAGANVRTYPIERFSPLGTPEELEALLKDVCLATEGGAA